MLLKHNFLKSRKRDKTLYKKR